MTVVVLGDDTLTKELMAQGIDQSLTLQHIRERKQFADYPTASAYIDLLFKPQQENIRLLEQLAPAPVFINSVNGTLSGLPEHFIRINGWPGFLKRPILEASCKEKSLEERAENIFQGFNKTIAWTPDVAGFLSARIVSMIINEAYYAFAEGVSTKEEIDIAMKTGTNYPYGPFEWGRMIGLANISGLLKELSIKQTRYQAAGELIKEAGQ